mmetsp:Transcript_63891/g.179899  ORF Transcript_63891/g.179899 Transcript_63891/m.179899 type:complete len:85 (+) Transcript_63891:210-464(+)|eukprot:CAMPEP_0179367212 /NCGR_PEP_ID=MMETSP0797-20121207/83453_1 /TAXON_ID=47934 /ORGANISM="Dinophysis acuminata, Strain DAEP01" /LENGTH=84 /DNA_ID=CAMNT_0021082745 /DNA_START=193 /DNA_END=447 /DNA_ORIENTATION=-
MRGNWNLSGKPGAYTKIPEEFAAFRDSKRRQFIFGFIKIGAGAFTTVLLLAFMNGDMSSELATRVGTTLATTISFVLCASCLAN